MLQVGKCLGVGREMRGNPGNQFESVTIHLLDGVHSHAVNVGRNFDQRDLPAEDEPVALEVVASAYKSRDGAAKVQVTAIRRRKDLEGFLFSDTPLHLSAVNE